MTTSPQNPKDILFEELQVRVGEAQKRLADTTQRLQIAQNEHAQAQQQFNIWNGALQTISRERSAVSVQQMQLPGTPAVQATESPNVDQPNKTDIVRNLLRDHPSGMTAGEMWKQVGGQFKYRAYFYNVLKRLRDKEEVNLRRNKYSIKVTAEGNHSTMVQ